MTEATADLDLVQRILRDSGVDQAVPTAGLSGYAQALAERLADWLHRRAPGVGGLFSWLAGLGPIAAWVVGGLVLVTLLVVFVQAVRARRARRTTTRPSPALARAVPERGRDDWRSELERRLAAGDVAGGLEALWWWFACSVASTVPVDPSWTSLELLARCRRSDLAPLARGLDVLLYGARRPGVSDLRQFSHRLDSALP